MVKASTSGPGLNSSISPNNSSVGEDIEFEDELVEWRTLQDRGLLLYRESILVRC
jgi:hypothetical protein